eukprot:TRINITY_DN90964_c0_g1_i1.p1 TRINITY_DN90964_c0_g1~~TRINITY_DN90964_c0_g1_i1.p1  ORF type:complete len:558 (-),score=64.50 TRINITY_DN90964_c0_g1_i1:17-1507(-)
MDAGSTGTRIHLFHYADRVIEEEGKHAAVVHGPMSLPAELFALSVKPGLSSFTHDLSGLAPYMETLVGAAAKKLAAGRPWVMLQDVPIYLGATAGMRALGSDDKERVLQVVRRVLHRGPFCFTHDQQARVLSGEEEGAFGWLSVNYQHQSITSKATTSFGTLDMGGESAQISFIPSDTSVMANLFPMHILPTQPIHLYTHSFLNFGYVTAFQIASKHILGKKAQSVMDHPCLPKGVTWHVDTDVFGVSTKELPTRTHGPLEMRGTSNFAECRSVARSVLLDLPCLQPPCSTAGVYQPNLAGSRFALIGNFAKAWQVLSTSSRTTQLGNFSEPPLVVMQKRAQGFCSLELQQQKWEGAESGQELDCWLAVWAMTLLMDGLGIAANSTNLTFETHNKIDWPQGQAVYEVNFFPYKVKLPHKKQHPLPVHHNRLWISLLASDPDEVTNQFSLGTMAVLAAVVLLAALHGIAMIQGQRSVESVRVRSSQLVAAREPFLVV